jgi:2-keto-4-pentenoate hydratase/2-oxohepta-3-ene-1,7-dioic acid hydratase in catechol pathway
VRIARFAAGRDPQYGVVELAEDGGPHPDTVSVLTGDPIAMSVQLTGERKELSSVRLLAPVIPRSKIVAVGRNYAAHAAEMGDEVPKTPLTFFKPNTSVIGPGEPIIYPGASREVSFEGELALVIGRICKEVPVSRVPEVIFGYTVANDATCKEATASGPGLRATTPSARLGRGSPHISAWRRLRRSPFAPPWMASCAKTAIPKT